MRGGETWRSSLERFLVEIIEFSLRNFLPRNIHGIIRNRFRKWRKRKWKKREFCSRFWDQIFLIFSFPRRTGMKRGLPAVSTRLVSQRFEDQLCADPTKLFDSYGWPTTCPSLASSWIIQWPLNFPFRNLIRKIWAENLGDEDRFLLDNITMKNKREERRDRKRAEEAVGIMWSTGRVRASGWKSNGVGDGTNLDSFPRRSSPYDTTRQSLP